MKKNIKNVQNVAVQILKKMEEKEIYKDIIVIIMEDILPVKEEKLLKIQNKKFLNYMFERNKV